MSGGSLNGTPRSNLEKSRSSEFFGTIGRIMVNYLAPNLTLKRFFCSNFTLLELNFKVFLIQRQWYFIEHLKIGQDFVSVPRRSLSFIVELRIIGIELGTAPRKLSEITETILYILIWTN